MNSTSAVLTLVGIFVLLFAVQAYWIYVTSQFLQAEHKIERTCGEKNPHDWVVEYYQWGNYSTLLSLVYAAVASALYLRRRAA